MAIGTIHSICHMLLTDRRLTPPGVRPRAPILLDEFAQYQFIYAAKNWSRLLAASGLGSHANSQITTYFENQSSPSRHRANRLSLLWIRVETEFGPKRFEADL